jgi:hypothetical protein
MPLHFAYGANMDVGAMARRCPRARAVGRARLMGWRFVLAPSGFASVVPDRRGVTHGVLWDMPTGDMMALDRFEQVGQGLYAKRILPTLREPFGSVGAVVYICVDPTRGAAWRGYLDDIIAAARAHRLPLAYIDSLAAFSALGGKGRL